MHFWAQCGKGKIRRCSVLHDSLKTLEDVSCPSSCCCRQLSVRPHVVLWGEQDAVATGKDSKEGWGRLSGGQNTFFHVCKQDFVLTTSHCLVVVVLLQNK